MWTSDDSYSENVWKRYQKAKKLIEEYKNSPVEDIAFLCLYLEECMKDYDEQQKRADEYWKENNELRWQKEQYKIYSEELEKHMLIVADNKDLIKTHLERWRRKYDFDN